MFIVLFFWFYCKHSCNVQYLRTSLTEIHLFKSLFLSCLRVNLYIIRSTFGGVFLWGGDTSKLYKPVLYEYEQCMYICFSCFAYFDLLLSTNFECRLWHMYCYWDSWVIEYQNCIYLSVCKCKAFNSRSYFCI